MLYCKSGGQSNVVLQMRWPIKCYVTKPVANQRQCNKLSW